jgi:Flp pilus assembly protein TadG
MSDLMHGSINKEARRVRSSEIPQRGQTLVEFALVVLIFLMVLFGILEFSRALWTYNTIVQATRAGARFAVVELPSVTNQTVKNYVVYNNSAGTGNPVLPGLSTSNVTVTYTRIDPNTGNPVAATTLQDKYNSAYVQVGITGYTFNFIVPILGSSIALPAFTTTLQLEALGAF